MKNTVLTFIFQENYNLFNFHLKEIGNIQESKAVTPFQLSINLLTLALETVEKIEIIWKTQNYQPDVILPDFFSLTAVILSNRNNIPGITLFSAFPMGDSIFKAYFSQMVGKIMIGDNFEVQRLEAIRLIEEVKNKFNYEAQVLPLLEIPEYIKFGCFSKERVFSIMPEEYSFGYQNDDYIFMGPMFRDSNEDLNFNFEKFNDKKIVYLSLGTIFNKNLQFFKDCTRIIYNITRTYL